MKLTEVKQLAAAAAALLTAAAGASAHEHLVAGANSTTPGSPLVFVNAGDYATNSGYVFKLGADAPSSPYDGWYYTPDLVFAALAATPNFGGPEAQAAALGSHIEIVLEIVSGPLGATLGFWETQQNGVDSTNLTWTVPAGLTNGTNHIVVSETDGSPLADPYGHTHGRIYSVDFSNLTFAAPSNLPDTGTAPATNYQLESTPALGPSANWQAATDLVVGDDHLHTVTLPVTNRGAFFRLNTF